ncbi:MAG: universal stress protein [Rickettsiales bacterium]|nr:universal stress protein [Rickettsiales bacterium]
MSNNKFLVCIDEQDHSRVALRFACQKAKRVGCQVEMLYVIDTRDFNNLFAVSDVMRKERRSEAETLLRGLAEDVHTWSGILPSLAVREGMISDEILTCAEEDADVSLLVLGAAPEGERRSGLLPVVVEAIGDKLSIPVLIVPGNLTDQQIAILT